MELTREQRDRKRNVRWWVIALTLYFATSGSAYLMARNSVNKANEATNDALQTAKIAYGESENAKELARQYHKQYQDALLEIAALKEENEELTRQMEEVSFALDEVVDETGWTSLGVFRITHYCPCEKCCGKWSGGPTASGTQPTAGRTVAVDPFVIPLGSEIRLNGHVYIAEDTGVHGNAIDVFVDDHQEALQLGMYHATVERRSA